MSRVAKLRQEVLGAVERIATASKGGATARMIGVQLPERSRSAIMATLDWLTDTHAIERAGRGGRADPYRYLPPYGNGADMLPIAARAKWYALPAAGRPVVPPPAGPPCTLTGLVQQVTR